MSSEATRSLQSAESLPEASDLSTSAPQAESRRKRKRNFTPSDRAQHRILEKKRREDFNDRMLELAQLLPGISTEQNLTKHIIVNESIRQLKAERETRNTLLSGVKALIAERDACLQELAQQDKIYNSQQTHDRSALPLHPVVQDMIRDEHLPIPSYHGILGNEDHEESNETFAGLDTELVSAWFPPITGNNTNDVISPQSGRPPLNGIQVPSAQLLQCSAEMLSTSDPGDTILKDGAPLQVPPTDTSTWWSIADDRFVFSPDLPLVDLSQAEFPWQTGDMLPLDTTTIYESHNQSHLFNEASNIWTSEHAGLGAQSNF